MVRGSAARTSPGRRYAPQVDEQRRDEEPRDEKAERRASRKARERAGMQVTNRGLKAVQLELDAQRKRNAARGLGPLTDEEVRRLGLDERAAG